MEIKESPNKFLAKTEVIIKASIEKVWRALVDPRIIKQYMFDVTVKSDWQVGNKIIW